MRLFNILILAVFFSFKGLSKTPEKLINRTIQNAPLNADNKDLDIILDQFYAYLKVGRLNEQDSIYQLFNDNRNLIHSKQDSAYSFFCLGYFELRKSNYIDARFYQNKAGILFEKSGDKLGALYTKLHMANLYYFMKRVEEAYQQYEEILANPLCDMGLTASVHHNIGALMLQLDYDNYTSDNDAKNQEKLSEIAAHFDESIRLYKLLKDEHSLAGTYSVYLNVKVFQDDFEGLRALLDSSESLAIKNNDRGRMAFLNIKKAMLYDTLGNFQMAIDTANKAASYYNSIENFDQEEHALSYVYRGYYRLEKYKEAADILKKINLIAEKRLSKELTTNLAKYEAEFETQKKTIELEKKQAQLEKEELSNSNKNIIIFILIIVTIAIVLLILLVQQKRKRILVENQNKEKITLKQQALQSIIEAQENERQRIAKDLHDGIVQQLGSLKIRLDNTFNEEEISDQFSITLLEKTTTELRELSHKMMPKSLDEFGLIEATQDIMEISFKPSKINYVFEHYGITERLSQKIEITIFRILQELINNIIKHSEATEVNVQLIKNESHTILIVEDNGIGFSKDEITKGIGLLNIRSRLDSVEGNVNYEHSTNSGTLVTIRIPNP